MNEQNPTLLERQHGFTLLEVLLAVMILALTVTAILQQFSAAQRAGIVAHENTRAVIHAAEKLEELKIGKDLSESAESGSFEDGYTWETEVLPFTYEAESTDQDEAFFETSRFETFELRARVMWQDGERTRQVELATLKTVKKKEWN